jgi:hypothetical protein
MRNADKNALKQISNELALLYSDMLELESSLLNSPMALHEAHRRSARNLAHYLALRRRDIRGLQLQLALWAFLRWAVLRATYWMPCRRFTAS